jgi:exosome complex RNA-binding protein Csl4
MAARKKTRQSRPKKATRKSTTRKTTQRKTAKSKTVKAKSKAKNAPKAGAVVYSDLRKIALARALTRH